MKEDIISQKISRELSYLPIDTEPRVVYLLVEIRKVLDHEDDKENLLYFFCNWVVHTKLSKGWAKKVLDQIGDENNPMSWHFIKLHALKKELGAFLEKYGLPTELVDNNNY